MKHSKTIVSVMIPACVWLLSGGQPARGADGTIVPRSYGQGWYRLKASLWM